ncbi:MAG: Na+/H+ antiporter NhaC [Bacteroidetes bacterium]|nr:MAG: Na+/H+ antiporter NhaC [Bacteroidota bacterium]
MNKIKKPSFLLALLPILVLIVFLALNINIWGDESLGGPNQLALIIGTAVAGSVAAYLGISFEKMEKSIVKNIGDAMPSILILLLIGALSGTWMISGVVPMLIVYGLDLLNPNIFLFATVLISSIVSISIGSSWSTIATIGVALLGIGTALGFSPAMVSGAIISGAYFGDKLSPLSDTTNLAPAMAGTDLFTHIKYMLYTTVPTLIITLIVFLVLGFKHDAASEPSEIEALKAAIESRFVITPWLLLVPAILIFVIVKKVSPLVALFIGTLAATVAAVVLQSEVISDTYQQIMNGGLVDNQVPYYVKAYVVTATSWFGSSSILTDNENVNGLLSTGGMAGMLDTIWLIIIAMAFSGVMESAGLLVRIASSIIKKAKSTGSLVASTVATSIFMNITASEQYISVVVPGRMYADVYKQRKLKPEVLSRSLEDGGTVTSVLVPWNTCGAVNSTVLGVSTMAYLPYAIFNLVSPLMSVLVAYLDFKIRRYTDEEYDELMRIEASQSDGGI